jgi:hypothetical protein
VKRPRDFAISDFHFVATVLLATWVMTPAFAQEDQNNDGGVVDDWTHHHVIFSNPGTLQDAMLNGRREEWERIVTDHRYRMQQIKRGAGEAALTFDSRRLREDDGANPINTFRKRFWDRDESLQGDWFVHLGGGASGVAPDMYPAKFTFSTTAAPSCANDFVVFPINVAGGSSQANLLGVNNLYSTTCSGTVPTALFAYTVGSGTVQTSPVLSENGTKVAFVESISSGSKFHVLTLDKSGNSGCPSSTPCNGTGFSSPATPGTHNSAADKAITMSGSVSVTRSSPFVDYTHDIAYVGDDSGKLHKFTGVFNGTPAEVTTAPWPFSVASGTILTGPVFDSGTSQNIFVGNSNGTLYCITSAGAACTTASISVGTGVMLDAPIVDSTRETVFATANSLLSAELVQATTALGSQVSVGMGLNGIDLYNGAFDNAYFTNVSTGHMYFCGTQALATTPTLWRVTFNSSGTMSSTNDGNSFQLVATGNTGTAYDCTPLTEFFNSSQGKDYLFLGVKSGGFGTGTPNCSYTTCVMSFVITSSFPTAANATTNTNLNGSGMSGIIIDNVSSLPGASQIYFGNIGAGTGVQASQTALQ